MKYSVAVLASFVAANVAAIDIGLPEEKKRALKEVSKYVPAKAEQHVIDIRNNDSHSGCAIWKEDSQFKEELWAWRRELESYTAAMREKTEVSPDLRTLFENDMSNREEVCRKHADVHIPNDPQATTEVLETKQALRGLSQKESESQSNIMEDFFSGTKQLSYLPNQGFMEPLIPPLRHPDMCDGEGTDTPLGNLSFQITDIGHICRNSLSKTSRTVFVDMGATYNFNSDQIDYNSPAIRKIEEYRKYGIYFDHIYAYEIRQWDTERVYNTIPSHMQGPLHWINAGVTGEAGHMNNPFTMLKENFDSDDFIVVKLDIDTPSVERPLFQQMLTDPELHEIVDVFYFEHHVMIDEMQPFWGAHGAGATIGTISESIDVFHWLRKQGVAAHYWI
mmetsp:Transcript_29212/g.44164  ORF Transcript_29212/g.44164 Transcript_29212/m.44164 type:complete len:391 (-) Transcript_29212:111-1283(-)